MSKFKIGQRVKIVSGILKEYAGYTGKLIKIDDHDPDTIPYRVAVDGRSNVPVWCYEVEAIEEVIEDTYIEGLTFQEVLKRLTMSQVVGKEGTDWSWYYQWGSTCGEICLVTQNGTASFSYDEMVNYSGFIIREKDSLSNR
jgi:hypothetical protein